MANLYNVSVFFEECEKRDTLRNTKIATFDSSIHDMSAPSFIVFYKTEKGNISRLSAMDLYKKERLGYSKRHYNSVPQKYIEYLYQAH